MIEKRMEIAAEGKGELTLKTQQFNNSQTTHKSKQGLKIQLT